MLPEPSPSSVDTVLEAATGDLARVLRAVVMRLQEAHQSKLDAAIAEARAESERARDVAIQNAVAEARAESERARDVAIQNAVAEARAELERTQELAIQKAVAEARAEWNEQRFQLEEQHAAALQALEVTLRSEAQRFASAHARDAEQRVREEMRASVADAVADAEHRGRLDRDEAVARATSEVEQRLRDEAGEAMRLAEDAFARRLASGIADPVPSRPVHAVAADPAGEAGVPQPFTEVDERETRLEMIERVLGGVERLDAAASLRAALDALADAVAAEAPRSVVFTVRGNRLHGWRMSGATTLPTGFANLDVPLDLAGPFAVAVSSSTAVTVHANALADDTAGALSWLDLADDRAGLVVPVAVDGRVVALVYADDGGRDDREVPGSWPESVQLLARHAARVLEVLTARRAADARIAAAAVRAPASPALMAPEEAHRFARLVVSEVKLYHDQEFRLGRELHDLRTRLAGPITHARRLFDERVPASLVERDRIFEEELQRTLAEGDAALLGQPGNATA